MARIDKEILMTYSKETLIEIMYGDQEYIHRLQKHRNKLQEALKFYIDIGDRACEALEED